MKIVQPAKRAKEGGPMRERGGQRGRSMIVPVANLGDAIPDENSNPQNADTRRSSHTQTCRQRSTSGRMESERNGARSNVEKTACVSRSVNVCAILTPSRGHGSFLTSISCNRSKPFVYPFSRTYFKSPPFPISIELGTVESSTR